MGVTMKQAVFLKRMLSAHDRARVAIEAVQEALELAKGGDVRWASAYLDVGMEAVREALAVLPRYGAASQAARVNFEDALRGLARPAAELRKAAQGEATRSALCEAAQEERDRALRAARFEALVNRLALSKMRGRG
jgi:hypothetical protein